GMAGGGVIHVMGFQAGAFPVLAPVGVRRLAAVRRVADAHAINLHLAFMDPVRQVQQFTIAVVHESKLRSCSAASSASSSLSECWDSTRRQQAVNSAREELETVVSSLDAKLQAFATSFGPAGVSTASKYPASTVMNS